MRISKINGKVLGDDLNNPNFAVRIGAPDGDVFNRFEDSAPIGDDVRSPGFESGNSTLTEGAEHDRFVIGIGEPAGDTPSVDALVVDDTSSGAAGASSGVEYGWVEAEGPQIVGHEHNHYNPKYAHDHDHDDEGGNNPISSNPEGGNIGVLLPQFIGPNGPSFTGDRNIDAALFGSKWGTLNLTYSFPTSGSNYNNTAGDPNSVGYSNLHMDFQAEQKAAARAAFAQISAATGMTFTEITETDTVHANIRLSQTADQDLGSAQGLFPSDTRVAAGDIWFGRTINSQPYYEMPVKGTWGFATIMHEIGHTMGLKHGMSDLRTSDISQFFGTSPRFGTNSLTPDRDGQAWSLMTYTPAPFTNGNFAGDKINQPQSYMQYDLAALQYMYGANYNTNSGDTVYTFSQTTGEMFVNGVGQGAPSGAKILLTIWDGGGNDTIDGSNYANGVTIDLRPGEFSTLNPAQLANHLAAQNLTALAPGNIAMSLLYNNDGRSLIENAKGGIGNDVFVGNTANNVLDGGAGSDTAIFTSTTGVNVTLNDTNADVIVTHDGETDTLRSIENIGGTSGNDTLTGNSQDNTLTGGSGGADVMSGGAGNDRLIGGGFTVTTSFDPGTPASQPDIVKPQATNNNSIANAVNTAGAYDLDANPDITNATTIPHATINATAAGGSVEYYRIDVTAAGAQAIFDIDGGAGRTLGDSILELVDSAGNLLATNDTGGGDAQPPGFDDSYLTFTFAAAGTYYIRVGQWTGTSVAQPMPAGTTYQLHISLEGAAGATIFTVNNTSSLVADGGSGNDVLVGTIANDTLNGGSDNDTASFVNAYNNGTTTGVTVDLNLQGAAQNTVAAGNDTLIGIENLVGSALNDTLTGDGNANILEGGLGDDTLAAGAGNDTASYAGSSVGVTVSLGLQGAAQDTAGAGMDTLTGFQNLLGGSGNDSLTGDASENVLTGGAGDDTLNPGVNGAGNWDLLDGGSGSDTASFAGYAAAVTAALAGALDGTAIVGGSTVASLRGIENLQGGSGNDSLTGDGDANVIEGGLGDDTLEGGGGVDTLSFTGSTAVTVNLATVTAQNTGWGSDTITGFENVRTGSGADNVTGDGNDNTFFEGGGADIYDGAGGSDTVDYSAATSTVTVNLNTVTAQNTGTYGGSDTITNMENVIGAAAFANALTGNAVANRLVGGSAADTLIGNNGADLLIGGAGNDVLLGGTNSALDDGSADILEGGAGSDNLFGGQGNDILRGGDGADQLFTGIGAAPNSFSSGIDGGDDVLDGGEGTDWAYMVYTGRLGVGGSTVGVSFDIGNVAGDSAITFNGANVGSITSIERLNFYGTEVDDSVKGGATFDTLIGNAGDDVLNGWHGNDTLNGGAGNDTLIGGEGLDTATYANATVGVNVDLRISGAQFTVGDGIDTLSGIEYLIGSGFGDNLRGNDEFNLLVDNGVAAGATALSQTDSLFGYGGADSILVTRTAAAVATNVNLDGGDGDDFIELRSGTLTAGLGTLGNGILGTTYTGAGTTSNDRNSDVVTVDGGAGNDRIILTGVASATVNAGSGADLVSISMRGASNVNNHQITLGSGADIIQFGVGSNAAGSTEVMTTVRTNRVADFQVGNAGDKFEMTTFLANGVLAGSGYVAANGAFASGHMRLVQSGTDLLLQTDRDGAGVANGFVTVFAISNGYTGGFTAFNFDGFIGNLTLTGFAIDETITGATGNDVLSGAGGNDTLNGLGGTDQLFGGQGNDLLDGGLGADSMNGGTGDDTYVVDDIGDQVSEVGGSGTDTVRSSISYALDTGLENLVLTGTDAIAGTGNGADNNILGNDGDNNLDGGGGADVVRGGGGADVLRGEDGNDLLFGDAGNDVTDGGLGQDWHYVDNADDVVIERDGEGWDRVITSVSYTLAAAAAVELMVFADQDGTDALDMGGNDYDNYLYANNGRNVLNGFFGTDLLEGRGGDDLLDGGLGVDTTNGGAGQDWHYVDNAGDIVIEAAGEGYDRVIASTSYTLGANAEVELMVTSNADGDFSIDLTGNDFNNYLYGNNGVNVLSGGGGDDILDGRGASDVLIGGAGADSFLFTSALDGGNVDEIIDFVTGVDRIELDDAVFAGLSLGTLADGAFHVGSEAADADDRIIYDNTTGALLFDPDGVGGVAAQQFAILNGAPALGASDFLVI